MGLSSFSYICITNNPALKGLVKPFEFVDASSLDVLKRGRSLVHEGWELLASPFYGNFKPNQQPYRTLVLRKNNGGNGGLPDAQSLSLIEDSVRFYENSHWIMPPGRLADNIEKDFRYMDMILLEETFRQYGILTSPVKSYSEVVDK